MFFLVVCAGGVFLLKNFLLMDKYDRILLNLVGKVADRIGENTLVAVCVVMMVFGLVVNCAL